MIDFCKYPIINILRDAAITAVRLQGQALTWRLALNSDAESKNFFTGRRMYLRVKISPTGAMFPAEPEVETVTAADEDEIVLDVRAPDEAEKNPLNLDVAEIKELQFYKIATEFGNPDQSKTYLLYCRNGMMSRLQALILKERGFKNVKVIRI